MDAPYFDLIPVCLGVIGATWLLSVITREYSWVDRLWSIMPAVYAVYLAYAADFTDGRLDLLAALVTAWGLRLTFNFWRRGGYAPGGEDYRWAVLRERLGPVKFQVFNATFVSPFQNAILLALVAPLHAAWVVRGTPLGVVDGVLGAGFMGLLIWETVADQQQWRFHRDKHAAKQRGEAVASEFCTTGLFRFSRHPAYFAEISLWWVLFAVGVAAAGQEMAWTAVGAAVLTGLFWGSTNFTESITAAKYPDYAAYQRRTSRLIPWPPRPEAAAAPVVSDSQV